MKKLMLLCVFFISSSLFGAAASKDIEPEMSECVPALDKALVKISLAHSPNAIKELVAALKDTSKKLNPACDRALFVGPPGTGKTTLAQSLAQKSKAKVHFFKSRELKGDKYARSGLVAIDTHLVPIIKMASEDEKGRHVVIIDEFDRLIKAKEDEEDSEDRVAYFWQVLDNLLATGNVFFVGTCNQTENFPAPLTDRLPEDCRYTIGLPLHALRTDALRYILKISKDSTNHNALLKKVADESDNMSLRLLQRSALKAQLKASRRDAILPTEDELLSEIRSHQPRQDGFFKRARKGSSKFIKDNQVVLGLGLTAVGIGYTVYQHHHNNIKQSEMKLEQESFQRELAEKSKRDAEDAQERQRIANEKFQAEVQRNQEVFQEKQRLAQEKFQIKQQSRSEALQKELHEDAKNDGWEKTYFQTSVGVATAGVGLIAANPAIVANAGSAIANVGGQLLQSGAVAGVCCVIA